MCPSCAGYKIRNRGYPKRGHPTISIPCHFKIFYSGVSPTRMAPIISGIILFDEAVFCAKKAQNPPEELKGLNLAQKLSDLIKLGIKVLVCGSCCEVKGLKKEELVEGAEVCCLTDVANAIKTSKQTIVF